jgi:hypothetical protein
MDLTMPTKKRNQSPSKKKGNGEGGDEKKDGLSSPTSISMQQSFIIANADSTFDAYY